MKITFNFIKRQTTLLAAAALVATGTAAASCSSNSDTPAPPQTDAGPDAQADTFTETQLSLELSLSAPSADPDAGAGDAGASDAGGGDAGAASTKLTIVARDSATPVITDLWLYTLDGSGNKAQLTGFRTSSANRKVPRRFLPSTIRGQSSGLAPADDGSTNGVMTDTTRGKFEHGAFTPGITGTVVVTLPSAPTSSILVVAGVEDQRYAGAAVINPDGTKGAVPAGAFTLETHTRRTFARDVAPLLQAQCASCHNPTGPKNAGLYLVAGSRDEIVNDNFAFSEGKLDCQTKFPNDQAALAKCIDALDEFEPLVEPGAPAISGLLVRARPDESGGTSPQGLAWYGSKGSRYTTKYGDRRMPSTTQNTDAASWTNLPAYFDTKPAEFQILYDWVAQGAQP